MQIRSLSQWENDVLAEALLTLMTDRANDNSRDGQLMRSRAATMLAGARTGRYLHLEDDGTEQDGDDEG